MPETGLFLEKNRTKVPSRKYFLDELSAIYAVDIEPEVEALLEECKTKGKTA